MPDLRKLMGLGLDQAKQQLIKRVRPDIHIQTKRAVLDVADSLADAAMNENMGRRQFLKKLVSKAKVRQNPINKEESVIRAIAAIKDIGRSGFSYVGDIVEF
jgi:hypothetical protein